MDKKAGSLAASAHPEHHVHSSAALPDKRRVSSRFYYLVALYHPLLVFIIISVFQASGRHIYFFDVLYFLPMSILAKPYFVFAILMTWFARNKTGEELIKISGRLPLLFVLVTIVYTLLTGVFLNGASAIPGTLISSFFIGGMLLPFSVLFGVFYLLFGYAIYLALQRIFPLKD